MVVVRIDVHHEGVGFDLGIAAGQLADDRTRVAVQQVHRHVNGVIVVRDANPRVLRGGLTLVRVALQEARQRHRFGPDEVVEAAVDLARTRLAQP